jgi:hypothetical protein
MRGPALGVWVSFFKQPDALPGRAPPPKKKKNYPNPMLDILFVNFNKGTNATRSDKINILPAVQNVQKIQKNSKYNSSKKFKK